MFIYKITNKLDNTLYVGQTIRTLKERWLEHCSTTSSYIGRAINKHGKENFTIEQIDTAATLEELNQKEIYWIEKLNSLAPNGYNLVTGGDSHKYSETLKEMYLYKEIVEISTGIIYKSLLEAAEKLNISRQSITDNLNGRANQCHGYVFKYSKDWDGIKINKESIYVPKNRTKKIVDVTTGIIYDSQTDAKIKIGKKLNIYSNLKGIIITTKGHIFKYLKDWDGTILQNSVKYIKNKRSEINRKAHTTQEYLEKAVIIGQKLWKSSEYREKMKPHIEKHKTEEYKLKMRETRFNKTNILCINDGRIYESSNEVGIVLNLNPRSVRMTAQGKLPSLKGYRFIYIENPKKK